MHEDQSTVAVTFPPSAGREDGAKVRERDGLSPSPGDEQPWIIRRAAKMPVKSLLAFE